MSWVFCLILITLKFWKNLQKSLANNKFRKKFISFNISHVFLYFIHYLLHSLMELCIFDKGISLYTWGFLNVYFQIFWLQSVASSNCLMWSNKVIIYHKVFWFFNGKICHDFQFFWWFLGVKGFDWGNGFKRCHKFSGQMSSQLSLASLKYVPVLRKLKVLEWRIMVIIILKFEDSRQFLHIYFYFSDVSIHLAPSSG